jgi:hypothetical protein
LCRKHYGRNHKHGTTELQPRTRAKCVICGEPVRAREWCSLHYQRWRTTGDPLTEPRKPSRERSAQLAREEAETGLRKCVTCKELKPLDEFAAYEYGRNGRSPSCKPCRKATSQAAHKRRKQRDPEQQQRQARKGHLLRKYGLTPEAYDALVESQEGRCAACGATPDQLCVDHDHATGAVRELLCNGCNCALGHVGDDADRLLLLIAYLRRHTVAAA